MKNKREITPFKLKTDFLCVCILVIHFNAMLQLNNDDNILTNSFHRIHCIACGLKTCLHFPLVSSWLSPWAIFRYLLFSGKPEQFTSVKQLSYSGQRLKYNYFNIFVNLYINYDIIVL